MCDDQAVLDDDPPAHPALPPDRLTRRRFIQAATAAAAGLLLPAAVGPRRSAFAAPADGTSPYSMAMHVHSSFSEQAGSMAAQLTQAYANVIDVLWMTDHDHRMLALNYRSVVHFTSLTAEKSEGVPWRWQRRVAGPLKASSSGGIVSSPASPNDPVNGGSLRVNAQSSGSSLASLGYYADSQPANWNYRGNLYGQTLTIDVLPSSIGTKGYLELLISGSYHPATGGRPAGVYSLSYRFGGPKPAGTRETNDIKGIVYVGVTPGTWNTVTLNPTDDIAALWPDMAPHDFASYGLTLSAVSTGGLASGYFDYLRFGREYNTGNVPVETQTQMIDYYSSRYSVKQYQGLEISRFDPHVNWFGGQVQLGDYAGVTSATYPEWVKGQVDKIHAAGGVASYNHPFGTSGALLSNSAQDAEVSRVAAAILRNDLVGCDIMEVGYPSRGGCDLAHHVALWDVLSCHARFTTGNGTNDDHTGQNWLNLNSNWFTSVWAPSLGDVDLVSALRAGRAWTASLSRFRGTLDLLADAHCPMGSASVVPLLTTRQLQVTATGMPAGGRLEVMRGDCGNTVSAPNTRVIATYSEADLTAGSATLPVDADCFVRTQVRDSGDKLVALSNPIWLLRETPAGGIPDARAC